MSTVRHLLVTNDFPPKIGGIQQYLWELWRRLGSDGVTVYCTPHDGSVAFDTAQPFRIERSPEPVLGPYPWLVERIDRLADEVEADIVLLDPAVPLGLIGPHLAKPYGVILHGAEVAIPGRLPGGKQALRRVLNSASLVISAGQYALDEAERCAGRVLPSVVIPPGVDIERFRPADADRRSQLRADLGLGPDQLLVAIVTRLVPRKGMHTLIEAAAILATHHPEVVVRIGGSGRDHARLQRRIRRLGAPVELLGRLDDEAVVDLYQAADVMCMPCNQRWAGLEQEGFGIVFLEAGATGLAVVAGRSGGAAEAVEHGVTGLVVDRPDDPHAVADALRRLVEDADRRRCMGVAARDRIEATFSYDHLAARLRCAIEDAVEKTSPVDEERHQDP